MLLDRWRLRHRPASVLSLAISKTYGTVEIRDHCLLLQTPSRVLVLRYVALCDICGFVGILLSTIRLCPQ